MCRTPMVGRLYVGSTRSLFPVPGRELHRADSYHTPRSEYHSAIYFRDYIARLRDFVRTVLLYFLLYYNKTDTILSARNICDHICFNLSQSSVDAETDCTEIVSETDILEHKCPAWCRIAPDEDTSRSNTVVSRVSIANHTCDGS